jgi:hypothetical protein
MGEFIIDGMLLGGNAAAQSGINNNGSTPNFIIINRTDLTVLKG